MPPPSDTIVPVSVPPSPQLIVAVKSAVVSTPTPAGSVKLAIALTAPVEPPSARVAGRLLLVTFVICGSMIVMFLGPPVRGARASCCTITVMEKTPSSAYV